MAGGLRTDAAIEQFAHMRNNTQDHFRFTRRGGLFLLGVIGLLPIGLGYLSYKTHGQVQLAANRRGQPLMRSWPERAEKKDEEPASA